MTAAATRRCWCRCFLFFFTVLTPSSVSTDQDDEEAATALASLYFNAWGLLPEKLLYCMVTSDDTYVREQALLKIISLRKNPQAKSKGKTKAQKRNTQAQFNLDAENWWDLVDINAPGVEKCPITFELLLGDLEFALQNGNPLNNIPKDLPAHSQSVERCVKLVTEASTRVFGFDQQHRYINTMVMSRRSQTLIVKATKLKTMHQISLFRI